MTAPISNCLRDFLATWHGWATGSADPVAICEACEELEQVFKSEFGDDYGYPFGRDAYSRHGDEFVQHLDPIRLAWVERVLESQDVTPRPKFYGQWSLVWDYGQWWATHADYDASYEGPEDGWVDNGLRTSARTLITLRQEIDAINEEKKLGN